MPRIPTLDRNRIQARPLSQGRLQTGDFVSQGAADRVNTAVNQLNTYRDEIQKKELQKADQIAIIEADQKLSAYETKLLYDPKTGATNKRGKDSFELPDVVIPEFDKFAGEIEQSLTSDYQKMSFQKMVADRRNHINNQIQRHVSAETRRYDEGVTKSYVANEMNAAIENFHDPDRIKLSIDRQRGAIMSHADRNGLDPETTKNLIEETQSKTHKSVIGKILNSGGVGAAEKYYRENKDLLVGEDRVEIDKALKEGIIQRDAMMASDKIFSKHSDNMQAALDKAREIKDPEKRDETVRRVKQRFVDLRASDEDSARQNFETAYNALEQNGGNLDAIPKSVYANLDAGKKETIKKIASDMRSGTATKTDINLWYGLQQMAANPDSRDKFNKLNLLEYRTGLSESDFQELAKWQNASRGGDNKLLDGIQTKQNIVNNALLAAGIKFDKGAGAENIKRANRFREMVDKMVVQKQEQLGRKVTNEELKDITDNLMFEGITQKGFFWDTKKRFFEVSPEEQFMVKVQDIDADEVLKIKNALLKKGIQPTDDKIRDLYIERLRAMNAK